MHIGYFTDFKAQPYVLLLSGSPADFALLRHRMAALSPDAPMSIHELEEVTPVRGTTLQIRLSRRERISRHGPASSEWEMMPDAFE